jgi:predicted aspartyl protease
LDDIKNNNLDTPFPKTIYLKELIETGKTLFGEKIIENIKSPEIGIIDLIEETSFEIATAMAAVRSYRNGDLISASISLKSALFGVRILEILKLKKFPYTYDEIFELSKELNLDEEYNQLLKQVMKVRQGGEIEEKWLFKNITFLNQVVMKEVKKNYFKDGNKIIL